MCLGLGCVDIKNMFFVRLVVYENLESDYVYLLVVLVLVTCYNNYYVLMKEVGWKLLVLMIIL